VPPRQGRYKASPLEKHQATAGKPKQTKARARGKAPLTSEHRALAAIVQGSRDALWTWKPDGTILRWNAAAERLFGYTPEEVVGDSIFRLIPRQRYRRAKQAIAKAARGHAFRQYETVRVRKDGLEIDVELTVSPILDRRQKVIEFLTVCRDVSDRKQAQLALAADLAAMTKLQELGALCTSKGHEVEDCLHAVVDAAIAISDSAKGSMQLIDVKSGRLRIAAQRGFDTEFLDFFADVDQAAPVTAAAALRTKRRAAVTDVKSSEIITDQIAVQMLLKAGVRAVQSTPLIDSYGDVFGVITTHFATPHTSDDRKLGFIDLLARQTADYLKRVRAEDALRELQNSLKAEVESRTRERDRIWKVSEDLLGVSNFAGYFLSVNPAWQRTLGWNAEEIRALHVEALRHPEDTPRSRTGREQLARGIPTIRMENRFRHKDGSWRWIAWTMTADDGLIYVAGRHITAEKEAAATLQRAQEQLANAQKMEALGQLTGGVAHDFNNIMMIVSGYAQILKGRIEDEKGIRALEAVQTAIARGSNLTRQLLSFARQQPLSPSVIHPKEAVGAIRDVLAGSATGKIELSIDIPDIVWPIRVDKSEFALALVNIALNARDAMPTGGHLSIRCENQKFQASDGPDRLSGDFVAISISDTGTGIPKAILSKVFDPFFTTKDADKGTGLGLSQVYGFARHSGGAVSVESTEEYGTTVTVYLPKGREPTVSEPKEIRGGSRLSGKITVLVVEDNSELRGVTVWLLNDLGYDTLEAHSAEAALAKIKGDAGIDLIFSDIVLGGPVDGIALAQAIASSYPTIPVLLTTGYARRTDPDLAWPVLRKPYDVAALDKAIQETVENHRVKEGGGRLRSLRRSKT
jgi:PAS domain S-box-containing protein